MAGKFQPGPDLDLRVARQHLAPRVDRAASAIRDEAQRRAPDAKVWVTMRDERVRATHVSADGQTIPANVPYILAKPGRGNLESEMVGGDRDLGMRPRDPALSLGNRIRCRCESLPVPQAIARAIHRTPTQVVGPRVSATVEARFPRVVESEYAESGGGWFRGSVNAVAARMRDAGARGT